MSQWKMIATFAALSLSMALTTGCLAPASEETTSDPETTTEAMPAGEAMPAETSGDAQSGEAVGEAGQAFFGDFFFRHHPFRPFFNRFFFPCCACPTDIDDFLGLSGCGGWF